MVNWIVSNVRKSITPQQVGYNTSTSSARFSHREGAMRPASTVGVGELIGGWLCPDPPHVQSQIKAGNFQRIGRNLTI